MGVDVATDDRAGGTDGLGDLEMMSLEELSMMPSSLNDACRTIDRLRRCITMAMGCLDAESKNPDERLAWLRLSDGMEGREPRAALSSTECGGGKSNPVTQAERDIINAAIIPPAPEADAWDRKRSKDGGGK
jgi:hypothetical protein